MPDHRDKQKKNKSKRFRSDGRPIWTRQTVHGPGVWATCVKGKEKQTVGELYDLFESLAEDLWPVAAPDGNESAEEDDGDEDIEKAIAKEVAAIKRPRKEQRFANCQTDTPCAIYISCKPPVTPVELIFKHVQDVERTGVSRTRYTHRLIPISGTCDANVPEIISLFARVAAPSFQSEDGKFWRVDLRVRNHNTLARDDIIRTIAKCVPEGNKVDLLDPELFILVEVFKSVCGMSVVREYHRYKKFNVIEIAQARPTSIVPDMGETQS